MKRLETVDSYIAAAKQWKTELKKLRQILLKTPLEETVKWGAPCYTHNGKNVVGIGAFKSYVGLWFHQGALLSDPNKALINAQVGKTKALRQWRFESANEIKPTVIKSYVKEAIALQESGKAIRPARNKAIKNPPDLSKALKSRSGAKAAFNALTPGKRREYAEYIAEAKREETRVARAIKVVPMILAGKGLNDKYRC